MRSDRIVPLIIAVALFMENMDSTVIATTLPAIAADIGTNPLARKLALTSELVSLVLCHDSCDVCPDSRSHQLLTAK